MTTMMKNVVVVVKGSLSREKREQQEYEVVFPPFSVQFKLPKNKEKHFVAKARNDQM